MSVLPWADQSPPFGAMLNSSLPICWPLTRILNVPLSAASGAMNAWVRGGSTLASDTERGVRSAAAIIPSATTSVMPGAMLDVMIVAPRRAKPRANDFDRLRAEFSFMQSPSGKFPARRSVRRRAEARYWTPHGNPLSRKKASVPGKERENWLHRGTADGPEYGRGA